MRAICSSETLFSIEYNMACALLPWVQYISFVLIGMLESIWRRHRRLLFSLFLSLQSEINYRFRSVGLSWFEAKNSAESCEYCIWHMIMSAVTMHLNNIYYPARIGGKFLFTLCEKSKTFAWTLCAKWSTNFIKKKKKERKMRSHQCLMKINCFFCCCCCSRTERRSWVYGVAWEMLVATCKLYLVLY